MDIVLVLKLKKTLSERVNANKKSNQDISDKTVRLVVCDALFSVILKVSSTIKPLIDVVHFDQSNYWFKYHPLNNQVFYERTCLHDRFCFMLEKLSLVLVSVLLATSIFFYYSFDKNFALSLRIAKSRLFSTKAAHRLYLISLEKSGKT